MNSGPCVVCGARNYSLSLGGPGICPSCDCGIPPKPKTQYRAPETLQGAERDFVVLNDSNNEQRTKKSMPMNITLKDIKELEDNVRQWEEYKKDAENTCNPELSDVCLKKADCFANKACEIWQRVLLSQ